MLIAQNNGFLFDIFIHKIGNTLAKVTKSKRENIQINTIGVGNVDITTDIGIQRLYYKFFINLYSNKLDILMKWINI
jgi:hypothetical protein